MGLAKLKKCAESFLLVVLTVMLCACKPSRSSVTGSVFVVTVDGASHKLGLVPVGFYEFSAVEAPLQANRARVEEKRTALLNAIAITLREADRLDAERKKKEDEATLMARLSRIALGLAKPQSGDNMEILNIRREQLNHASSLAQKADQSAVRAQSIKSEFQARRKEFFRMCQVVNDLSISDTMFSTLPAPVASTKTDADGMFRFELPHGLYVLIARATRQTGSLYPENYAWFVKLAVKESATGVMLSNDSLVTSGSSNTVITLPSLPSQCTTSANR